MWDPETSQYHEQITRAKWPLDSKSWQDIYTSLMNDWWPHIHYDGSNGNGPRKRRTVEAHPDKKRHRGSPESELGDQARQDKRPIGTRAFPEGVVINWGKGIPVPKPLPMQTMVEKTSASVSAATHPRAVVDVIDVNAIPPRYQRRADPLVHNSSTRVGPSSSGNEIKDTCQLKGGASDIGVSGNARDTILVFRELPSGTHVQDISLLLSIHNFSPSVVRAITLFEQVATVQFLAPFIADSAFETFQNMEQSSHWQSSRIRFVVERPSDQTQEMQHHAQHKGFSSNPSDDAQRVISYIDLTEDHSGDDDEAISTSSSSSDSSRRSIHEPMLYFDKPSIGTASVAYSHFPGVHLPQEEIGIPAEPRRSSSASGSSSKQGSGYHFERRSVPRNQISGARSNRPAPASSADSVSAPSAIVRSQNSTPLVSRRPTDGNVSHRSTQTIPLDVPALSRVPQTPFNRARRVLILPDPELPIVTVSMRADTHFFHPVKRHRISSYSMPCQEDYQHVEDACVVGDAVVVGYGDGPQQISLLRMNKDRSPRKIELNHKPHSRPVRCGRPDTKGATLVSCLAAACSSGKSARFFTGGYDKSIRRWTLLDDHGSATSERITQVTTAPFALASRGRQILIAAGRNFLNIDLDHLTEKPKSVPLSNPVYQIHVHPQAPNITILETSHLDSQVHIFDDRRKRGLDRAPDCHFGYRHVGPLASRYSRGSTHHSYFVKGYPDGCICVWDYRSTQTPVVKIQHQRVEPVVHTVFTKSEIICFGKDTLTFLDHHGNIL